MDIDAFWLTGDELRALEAHPLVGCVQRGYGFATRGIIEQPIVLLDGLIIDGRSRWHEARRLGVPCPCVKFDQAKHGTHPVLFVARHLGDHMNEVYERAITGVKLGRYVMTRPACLSAFDDGWPSRLHRKQERLGLASACGVSQTEFERAWSIRDARILEAAMMNHISLKDGYKLHALRLGPARTKAILDLPTRADRRDAINDRAKECAEEKLIANGDARQGELWPPSFDRVIMRKLQRQREEFDRSIDDAQE
ncbi:hypothetical protein [Paraburkholderia sp. J67]|uniref:hypothetical protein n=1 Tax=Paraburkholderia sp. J67 TaxID=2805435 RepID=UPI002ABDD35C|nr:hypothetical protein [Paraburkholderia sp. J67]